MEIKPEKFPFIKMGRPTHLKSINGLACGSFSPFKTTDINKVDCIRCMRTTVYKSLKVESK